jgi:hypothetical protein
MNERELLEAYVRSLEWEVGDWENVLRRALAPEPRRGQPARALRPGLAGDAAGWGTRPLGRAAETRRDDREVAGWGTRPL